MEEVKEWRIDFGVHDGTWASRDTGSKSFYDKDQALAWYTKQWSWFASIGYKFWYANLIDPDGNSVTLEQNAYH